MILHAAENGRAAIRLADVDWENSTNYDQSQRQRFRRRPQRAALHVVIKLQCNVACTKDSTRIVEPKFERSGLSRVLTVPEQL